MDATAYAEGVGRQSARSESNAPPRVEGRAMQCLGNQLNLDRQLLTRATLALALASVLGACSATAQGGDTSPPPPSTPTDASTTDASTTGGAATAVTLPLDSGVVEGAYTLELEVGDPAQTFHVVVDSGSANLILLGDSSLCDNCSSIPNQKTYDPSKSSTATLHDTEFSIHYGSGELKAREVTDRLTLGSFAPREVTFGVMTHQANIQNILGLAYEAVAQPRSKPLEPFFDGLVSASGIPNAFAMTLCEGSGSQITFGASDPGMAHYLPITEEKWYVVDGKRIEVNGQSLGTIDIPTVVDSGTTELMVPSALHEQILKALQPTAQKHGLDLSATFVATTSKVIADFPSLQIVVSDSDGQPLSLEIPPQNYFKPAGPSGFLFYVGINDQEMLLGQVFMKGYDVLFDRANRRIGLGSSSCPSGGS